jgi:hypothetical protein
MIGSGVVDGASRGQHTHDVFAAAERVEAIASDTAVANVGDSSRAMSGAHATAGGGGGPAKGSAASKAGVKRWTPKGGKGKVEVEFGRRGRTETFKLYSEFELAAIVLALVSKTSTRLRQNVGSARKIFSVEELATRSPPIFWSIYKLAGASRGGSGGRGGGARTLNEASPSAAVAVVGANATTDDARASAAESGEVVVEKMRAVVDMLFEQAEAGTPVKTQSR